MISYARIAIDFDFLQIQNEVLQIGTSWPLHFNNHDYNGEWSVLALKSPGGDANNLAADLVGKQAYAETNHMENFPAVQLLLQSLKCETMAVRFLNLASGSHVKPHRDFDLNYELGEARLHFVITTNQGVDFFINSEKVIMEEGSAWYINANMVHHVSNFGDTNRIHLVIDCKVNDWFHELIKGSIKKHADIVENKNDLSKIIAELRHQNTFAALQLADQLEKENIQST